MCVALAAITASQMAAASLAATAISAGVSAVGARKQAKAQNAINANNQQIAENNAMALETQSADTRAKGEADAQAVRRQALNTKSQQRVGFASAGVDLQSGTPFDLIGQTDFFGEQDVAMTRYNAGKQAASTQAQADNARRQGQNYSGRTNANMAAATSLLGSASAVADKWNTYSTAKAPPKK